MERGQWHGRENRIEAGAIAKAAREHLAAQTGESLGIVAMDGDQQRYIASILDYLAKQDARFGKQLDGVRQGSEPLLKSVEHVRSDARDAIFIFLTYDSDTA